MALPAKVDDYRRRTAQVVKEAANTPQGRALLDLLEREFGEVHVYNEPHKTFADVGALRVVQWLKQMEAYKGINDD